MTAEAILAGAVDAPLGAGVDAAAYRPPSYRIAGGVVAHNEESGIEPALRSLLGQALPEGVEWSRIWVVASGCTDRTVALARRVAREDPRVAVVVEETRRGKAAALAQIFARAEGDALVLLNADAIAEPAAVDELLRVGRNAASPFAVMARPVVGDGRTGRSGRSLELMWELHHRFHERLTNEGGGAHLSDELLLLSLDPPPPLPDGVINDGSYFGVWLAQHGAPRRYADRARVRIVVPSHWSDHLHQRRRIRYGNLQVEGLLGEAPSTLAGSLLARPAETLRTLHATVGARPGGWSAFAPLLAAELTAHVLARWDRLLRRKDHVRWRRIRASDRGSERGPRPTSDRGGDELDDELERRIVALWEVSRQFGTPTSLTELLPLLPPGSPRTLEELATWLDRRPHLARPVEEGDSTPGGPARELEARWERGRAYRAHAERLIAGPLRAAMRWVRTIAITGSVAYGAPSEGDDLDLFVVCRRGTVYLFLAVAYLALRAARRRGEIGARPTLCLNFVVDERRAREDFGSDRGLLFAREALSASPVVGDAYYRGLLAGAPWMGERTPGLYADRSRGPWEFGERSAPFPIRLANTLIFLPLAAYLQLAGLVRNHRMRGVSDERDRFRTRTGFDRVAFVSRRFERLRAIYGDPPEVVLDRGFARSPVPEPMGAR